MNRKIEDKMLDSQKSQEIAICIITCFRPDGLRRLLESLVIQKFVKNAKPNIRIVVVDNDSEGSAQSICDDFIAQYEIKLEYDIEKKRGIPFARNHAVDMVKNNVDFIAILDDDEVAAPNWLDELMAAQQEFEADILTGPVTPHFMGPTAHWLKIFFKRTNLTNGQNLQNNYDYVYTSNLLAKANLFKNIRFEEYFALSGVDDTHLFMQVFEKGYKAIWAEHAVVTEWLPESRANPQWLWKRAYRRGNGFAICEIVQNGGINIRIQRVAKGIFRCLQGIVITIISLGRKPIFVRGVQMVCFGVGMVTGGIGVKYQEYKKIHVV
jgi:succinoglycan biosynthesis protein ExoM